MIVCHLTAPNTNPSSWATTLIHSAIKPSTSRLGIAFTTITSIATIPSSIRRKATTMSHHAPTSRPKPPPPGEEEASSVLKLGEFQDVDTLTLSEASLVINALLAKRKKDRKDRNETEILNKTLDYLDAFARIKGKENVEAAERLLSARKELTKFERAQIGMFLRWR